LALHWLTHHNTTVPARNPSHVTNHMVWYINSKWYIFGITCVAR